MNIRSLGYRTDLNFLAFDGELHEREDYWAIRTPANPTYHWGNFLLFKQPPQVGDYERWRGHFQREITDYYGGSVNHFAFGWDVIDGERGEVQPFVDAGFDCNTNAILTATRVTLPPKWNADADIRILQREEDWHALLELTILCFRDDYSLEGYTRFYQRQIERHRAMIAAGHGHWFGAFLDGNLVASLGLFCWDGVGRFSSVGTHPAHRRLGLCGTLVYTTAQWGFKEMGAGVLVMAADEAYHAAKIYESVGFQPTERQVGMDWWERPEVSPKVSGT